MPQWTKSVVSRRVSPPSSRRERGKCEPERGSVPQHSLVFPWPMDSPVRHLMGGDSRHGRQIMRLTRTRRNLANYFKKMSGGILLAPGRKVLHYVNTGEHVPTAQISTKTKTTTKKTGEKQNNNSITSSMVWQGLTEHVGMQKFGIHVQKSGVDFPCLKIIELILNQPVGKAFVGAQACIYSPPLPCSWKRPQVNVRQTSRCHRFRADKKTGLISGWSVCLVGC